MSIMTNIRIYNVQYRITYTYIRTIDKRTYIDVDICMQVIVKRI